MARGLGVWVVLGGVGLWWCHGLAAAESAGDWTVESCMAAAESSADPAFKRSCYEFVLTAYPQHPEAPRAGVGLGLVLYAQKEFDAAEAQWGQVITSYPGTAGAAEAQMRLGYSAMGRVNREPDPALKAVLRQEAADEFFKAFTEYVNDPTAARAHAQYAGILFEQAKEGWFSLAYVRDVCEEVISLYPAAPPGPHAVCLLMISETFFEEGDYASCREVARQAYGRYPDAPQYAAYARWMAGQACEQLGLWGEALGEYMGVLQGPYTSSDNLGGRDIERMCTMRVAQCWRRLGDYSAARQWMRQVIQSWPQSPEARTAVGILSVMPPQG